MRLGIVGLPNAGKSTLFNALTRAGVETANYPFTTIDRHVGAVTVPDERLEKVAEVIRPERVTPTTIEVVDIAGLVRGASRGEGLGNRFLGHIREVDGILHVVRCHQAADVAHVEGTPDPQRDAEIVETELMLADLDTVNRRRQETARKAKSGQQRFLEELRVLERLADALQRGIPARQVPESEVPFSIRRTLFLLSDKPVLWVANIGEDSLQDVDADPCVQTLRAHADSRGEPLVSIAAGIEWELAQLPPEDAQAWREEMGVPAAGMVALIQASYRLLGLLTFFTVNQREARAWTLPEGATAWEAAGRVHTDMQQGFVRAEVVGWDELVRCGGFAAAREAGSIRSEGRDYVVRDGEILTFRFTP